MRMRRTTLLTASALAIVVVGVGGVGTSMLIRHVEQTYVVLQTEANRQQATRVRSLLDEQLAASVAPEEIRQRLQAGLSSGPFDPSGFLCLLGAQGEVLCHPDPQAVGMRIGSTSILQMDRQLEGTIAERVRHNRGGPGILPGAEHGRAEQLVYQIPVQGQPWLVSVHSDLGALFQRAQQLRRRILGVVIPIAIAVVLIGTWAVRNVARDYEGKIERTNSRLEERVRERTRELTETVGELQSARATLIHSEKMALLGQLMSGLAHELNQPLTVVLGQAQLGARGAGDDTSRGRFQAIRAAGERCENLVRSLLSFARSSPPERQPRDVADLIHRSVRLAKGELERARIQLETAVRPDLPRVMVDAVQIEQVILNLLNNARQALAETRRSGHIAVAAEAAGEHVLIRVADNAGGLPASIQEHLFEPFRTTKPDGIGTGLGLSLCRRFVRAHGGEIMLRSSGPEGTVFEFTLPALESSASRAA